MRARQWRRGVDVDVGVVASWYRCRRRAGHGAGVLRPAWRGAGKPSGVRERTVHKGAVPWNKAALVADKTRARLLISYNRQRASSPDDAHSLNASAIAFTALALFRSTSWRMLPSVRLTPRSQPYQPNHSGQLNGTQNVRRRDEYLSNKGRYEPCGIRNDRSGMPTVTKEK
jgi:hypothetical protein